MVGNNDTSNMTAELLTAQPGFLFHTDVHVEDGRNVIVVTVHLCEMDVRVIAFFLAMAMKHNALMTVSTNVDHYFLFIFE